MANRRCFQILAQTLYKSTLYPNPFSSLQSFKTLTLISRHNVPLKSFNPKFLHSFSTPNLSMQFTVSRNFLSNQRGSDKTEEDDNDDDDENDEEMGGDVGKSVVDREYSLEEKESEAAEIGYKVIGQLERSDRVFKPYEPVFAVIQIGSHQFKVSNGDCIYTEKLKFCEVQDKLLLNKVLMLGSKTQTIIGRPILPDAAVHAVVEEHALDAKVIIFKKKRRKNYRRTKGHRLELTKLRITDIQGIERPERPIPSNSEKASAKKVDQVPVAA